MTHAFWSRGRVDGECLVWTGARLPAGYGYFYSAGKMHYVHRRSWSLANATTIPKGSVVCHSCDNPSCFRPSHLFLGTQSDNMRDAKKKGRLSTGVQHGLATRSELRPIGEKNAMAKLTDDDVRQIREQASYGVFQRVIGLRFGVAQSIVSLIVRRKAWRHVP